MARVLLVSDSPYIHTTGIYIPGVYSITCIPTGKMYVGSSRNTSKRWHDHQRELTQGSHYNPYLQRAWNKYGSSHFAFQIIHPVRNPNTLPELEKFYIDFLDVRNPANGFNLSDQTDGGPSAHRFHKGRPSWNKGKKMNSAWGNRIRQRNLGKKRSLESIAKQIATYKTRVKRTTTWNSKIGIAQLGEKNHMFGKTPWNKGKPWSSKMKAKLSQVHIRTHCKYGHPFTQESIYIVPKTGVRTCSICKKNRSKRHG